MTMRDGGRSQGGFTLIELLVVITTIALLMAIMVPALQKVKSLAAEKVCSSRLRQINLALVVYAEDYDGQYPLEPTEHNDPYNMDIADADMRSHRSLMLKLGVYEDEGLGKALYCPQARHLEKFASNADEYIPAGATDSVVDTPENRQVGNIGYVYWSFIENKYSGTQSWRNPKYFIPRQLKTTGVRWLHRDRPSPSASSGQRWVLSDWFRRGAPFPHARKHARGLNVVYLDGHVDLVVGKPKNNYR